MFIGINLILDLFRPKCVLLMWTKMSEKTAEIDHCLPWDADQLTDGCFDLSPCEENNVFYSMKKTENVPSFLLYECA